MDEPAAATLISRLPTITKESRHDNSLLVVYYGRWHFGCMSSLLHRLRHPIAARVTKLPAQ